MFSSFVFLVVRINFGCLGIGLRLRMFCRCRFFLVVYGSYVLEIMVGVRFGVF